ncbi:MAG: tRNA (adenine-N1)-methyltransferase [candidate division WOR-3 bacterium]|nr:tRNA (adenine-N1)-methyltransferase [candidate division WOR-3 bacterium]MCX7756707.1 tRNA (adenine-N1)-methyltransferase [candidate division WOR-3 bacterium]MDW7988209.1 tRNA (adenine-N1)-methyltransferase [candidate division WOR-3 bacterium]
MFNRGDVVLLYHNERANYLITIQDKDFFSTHKGNISYTELLSKNFGDVIYTHLGVPFYILRPTLADLALKVRRTTTIIYPKDAGLMLLKNFVYPGARIIEAGTGSGALTMILANFVRPDGKVYSYEKREDFSKNAQENLNRVGLSSYVEFYICDIERDGFIQKDVDAVFLDLPEPWIAIRHAYNALKGGHSLVSLSPNIEQIKKTKAVMELEGFVRIKVVEILERELLVRITGTRPIERMVSHTGYLIFAQKAAKPQETLKSDLVSSDDASF